MATRKRYFEVTMTFIVQAQTPAEAHARCERGANQGIQDDAFIPNAFFGDLSPVELDDDDVSQYGLSRA